MKEWGQLRNWIRHHKCIFDAPVLPRFDTTKAFLHFEYRKKDLFCTLNTVKDLFCSLDTENVFSLGPSYRMGRFYKWNRSVCVTMSVITSKMLY